MLFCLFLVVLLIFEVFVGMHLFLFVEGPAIQLVLVDVVCLDVSLRDHFLAAAEGELVVLVGSLPRWGLVLLLHGHELLNLLLIEIFAQTPLPLCYLNL